MDKSSSAKCLLYSDVVKGEPSPTGRGRRRSRDEKGNQGVGDFRFTNILQLFSIYFSFFFNYFTLSLFFYTFFTHDIFSHPHPRPTTFSYTLIDKYKELVLVNYKDPDLNGHFDDCRKDVLKELHVQEEEMSDWDEESAEVDDK